MPVKVAIMENLKLVVVGQQFGGDRSGARCKARHDIKGNVGDLAFGRSKGVGAEVGKVPKLLISD